MFTIIIAFLLNQGTQGTVGSPNPSLTWFMIVGVRGVNDVVVKL